MGMFDWVRFETDCPKCGEHLEHFQSKNGYCVLEQVKPHKVTNFYASCHNCKAWIEYYKEHGSKKWTRSVSIGIYRRVFKEVFERTYNGKVRTDMNIKRDDYLDGNTQADFDAVNNANANMQMEIIELRARLARLIRAVRRAQKGKISVGDIKL